MRKWQAIKYSLCFFCLFPGVQSHAQYGNEVNFFTQYCLPGTYIWQDLYSGIQYKHYIKKNSCYRLSAGWGGLVSDYLNHGYYKKRDTITATIEASSVFVHMPIVSAGYQWEHKLGRTIKWYYGCDLNVGYNADKKDSGKYYYRYAHVVDTVIVDSGSQNGKRRENILYTGLQPFAGIKARWNRVGVGIEASCLFMEDILMVNKKSSTLLTCAGGNVRLNASYYFKGRSGKKSRRGEGKV